MTDKKKDVPKLRFPGFADPWEQRKLGELSDVLRGKGLSLGDLRPNGRHKCILYGSLYTDYGMVITSVFGRTDMRPRNAVTSITGDVLVPGSDTTPTGLARASCLVKPGVIIGGDINIIRPSLSVDGRFLSISLNSNKAEMIRIIKGSTVRHIYGSDLKKIELAFPTNTVEQKKIAELFIRLDDLITLHQRKLKHLEEQKKGLLQKMFPKDGELVPEVRFPGFTDPWEQRKLGDLAEIVGGGTPSTNNQSYWDGQIDWYTPSEIGSKVYAYRSKKRITENGLKQSSATLLPANKTILFTSRASIGDSAILRSSATTNQGFQSLIVCDETDVYFLYSTTPAIKKKAVRAASGSTFLEISSKGMRALPISIPSYSEQHKIGNFFKSLDSLITLHQRKLENLQEQKKALLQQMFI